MSSTDSELLTDEQKREILLDNIKPLLIQKYSDVNLTYEELLEKVKKEKMKPNKDLIIRTRQDKKIEAITSIMQPMIQRDVIKQLDIDVKKKIKRMTPLEIAKLRKFADTMNNKLSKSRALKHFMNSRDSNNNTI